MLNYKLQQNKKIAPWKIEWISNVVKIWTSNAHKNFNNWLSGWQFYFFIKIDKLKRNLVLNYQILGIKTIFYEFLFQNNLYIFVIFTFLSKF